MLFTICPISILVLLGSAKSLERTKSSGCELSVSMHSATAEASIRKSGSNTMRVC